MLRGPGAGRRGGCSKKVCGGLGEENVAEQMRLKKRAAQASLGGKNPFGKKPA